MDGGQITTITLNIFALIAIIIGIAVLGRKEQSNLHRIFFLLTIAIAGWITTYSIFDGLSEQWRFVNGLASYVFAGLAATLFATYALLLGTQKKKLTVGFGVVGVLLSAASGLPGVVASGVTSAGVQATSLIGVYVFFLAIYLGVGVMALLWGRKRAVGTRRRQIQATLNGVVGATAGGILFYIVLLNLGNQSFAKGGAAFTMLFVVASAYPILRHQLFDIRGVFARVLAYLVSVIIIAFGFGLTLALLVEKHGFRSEYLQVALVLTIFAITFAYPLIKAFFDSVTREIFFRTTYDSQQAIDDMTGVFVQADTLKELLENTSRLLMKILGASAVTVSLTHADGAGQRVAYTTLPSQAEHPEPVLTEAHMLAAGTRLVALDALDETQEALGAELNAMNIGVVSQLHSPVGIVGYLMIGYKQNGTHYGRQDLDFIDIVGDEFAIAIQSELRFDEIKAFNIELQHKIDEATKELQASNKKLQELDQAKDEFISMASHQLRTPLTTVKGYLSMVLEGDVGKVAPNQKKVLEEAYDSAQRMVFLIGDFLNVSRLQTGRFIMEWAPADLSKIVSQEVSQLVPSATSRKLKLVYEPPTSLPEMIIDENKLRQVMMNFIDNAIYYSKPNTTIDVSLVKLANEVVFKVVDHGIGVPVNERPELFTKFYRASNAKKQRPDGTGIGLFMAKKVIVAHGGSVIFETEEGKGSTFGFSLPLKNDPKQLDEQPNEDK